jgi:hypothetical protein
MNCVFANLGYRDARRAKGLFWSFGTPLPQLVRDEQGRWQPNA